MSRIVCAVCKATYEQFTPHECLEEPDIRCKVHDGLLINGECDWCTQKEETPDGQAMKFNKGKPKIHLIPMSAVFHIAAAYEHGLKKYERENWRKGLYYSDLKDSLLRHVEEWWEGEELDPESGKHHLAQAGFNLLTLIWNVLVMKLTDFDDRPTKYEGKDNG